MFKTSAVLAALMMILAAPASAQYLGNRSANPYAPHSPANPYAPGSVTEGRYGSPNSLTNPYAAPKLKLYGSPGADRRQLPINPYDPDSINSPYGRYDNPYAPDRVRNPYGAGNPYAPKLSTTPQDAH